MDGENIIIPKKSKAIDVEDNHKKGKNRNKNLNRTTCEVVRKEQPKPRQPTPPKVRKKKGQDRIVSDIKAILSNHKEETIRAVLQKYNYDKNQAMQELFGIPEDEDTTGLGSAFDEMNQSNKKELSKEERGNRLLDEIYNEMDGQGLEMNPTEFEQLFEEITNIIQQDQRSQGVKLIEINEFVDSCFSIKEMMLEGHELYIDEDDEVYRNTEEFLYETLQKHAMIERKREKDFPTIGSIEANNPAASNQKNLLQKIQEGYQVDKKKEHYFTPSKVPSILKKSVPTYQGSIYSLNDDYRSHADVMQLSKEYNNMGIENLKFIYMRMQYDINLAKQFLQRYYPDKKSVNRKQQTTTVREVPRPVRKSSYEKKKKIMDENYKNYSLEDIRQELDHLYKLRNMFRMTRGKITNVAHRKELERLSCRDEPTIRKLCEVARIKLIEEMADSHPQYVDMHGYREEEVDEVLDDILDMVRSEFRKGNSLIQARRMANNTYCVVKIMTGKGRHSKYGKSVLKPAVTEWSQRKGFKATESEDSIDIFVAIS